MDTSFQKPSADAEAKTTEGEAPDEQEFSPATQEANASPATTAPGQNVSGEWGADDVRIPYLSLVQKQGNLAEDFPVGSFVLNKELVVMEESDELPVTILAAHKYFEEDIEFDPDIRPRRFQTAEAAADEGYAIGYTDDEDDKRVVSCCDCVVLLPVPGEYAQLGHGIPEVTEYLAKMIEAKHLVTSLKAEDLGFARGLWTLRKSAYTSAGKTLGTAIVSGHLKDGVHKGNWSLSSKKRVYRKNTWHVPVLKSLGRHRSAFVDWIETEAMV